MASSLSSSPIAVPCDEASPRTPRRNSGLRPMSLRPKRCASSRWAPSHKCRGTSPHTPRVLSRIGAPYLLGAPVASQDSSDGQNNTKISAQPTSQVSMPPSGSDSERRKLSMEEYKQLKSELNKLTGIITGLGSAYCFLGYSLETALSFAFGCIFSVAYLQELYKAADGASTETVPELFLKRLSRRRTAAANSSGTAALTENLKRVSQGMALALLSPRLLLPGVMVLAWAASVGASGGNSAEPHLELAPLLLGFFSYKAAVLVITFRGQVDLL